MQREMNEIEQRFYNVAQPILQAKYGGKLYLLPQAPIGLYIADFILVWKKSNGSCTGCFVIEIDGHDFHKTKEQREHDYKKERYLLTRYYTTIRFTGTEVHNNPERCVEELVDVIEHQTKLIVEGRKGLPRWMRELVKSVKSN